jgi:serine/threonine-protein kinase
LGPRLIGQRLLDRYVVVNFLGEGPVGAVMELESCRGGVERFAAKMLHPRFVREEKSVRRFFKDAEAAGRTGHGNVARVVATGVDNGGAPLIVREFLQGDSLARVMDEKGKLSRDRAIRIARGILDGLYAVHQRGVANFDLAPGDVFLVHPGDSSLDVKLVDFGEAHLKARLGAEATRTSHPFLAPELWQDGFVDERADLWGTAAILYFMLTGQAPFGDEPDWAGNKPPAPASLAQRGGGVDKLLDAVLRKALSFDPGKRYPDAASFEAALARVMGERPSVDPGRRTVPAKVRVRAAELPPRSVLPSSPMPLPLLSPPTKPSGAAPVRTSDAAPARASDVAPAPVSDALPVRPSATPLGEAFRDLASTAKSSEAPPSSPSEAPKTKGEPVSPAKLEARAKVVTKGKADAEAKSKAESAGKAESKGKAKSKDEAEKKDKAESKSATEAVPAGPMDPGKKRASVPTTAQGVARAKATKPKGERPAAPRVSPSAEADDSMVVVPKGRSVWPLLLVLILSCIGAVYFLFRPSGSMPSDEAAAGAVVAQGASAATSDRGVGANPREPLQQPVPAVPFDGGLGDSAVADAASGEVDGATEVQRVVVSLRAEPAHAKLHLDGEALAANPFRAELEPSDEEHLLMASAKGFRSQARTIRFLDDTDVVLQLEAEEPPPAPPRPAPASSPSRQRPAASRGGTARSPGPATRPTPAAKRTKAPAAPRPAPAAKRTKAPPRPSRPAAAPAAGGFQRDNPFD